MDRQRLYDDAADFFSLGGSVIMKLTPDSAIQVCLEATERKLLVRRIEGGKWHNPGFEARLDCIWDRESSESVARDQSNQEAASFIAKKRDEHQAFVITIDDPV